MGSCGLRNADPPNLRLPGLRFPPLVDVGDSGGRVFKVVVFLSILGLGGRWMGGPSVVDFLEATEESVGAG